MLTVCPWAWLVRRAKLTTIAKNAFVIAIVEMINSKGSQVLLNALALDEWQECTFPKRSNYASAVPYDNRDNIILYWVASNVNVTICYRNRNQSIADKGAQMAPFLREDTTPNWPCLALILEQTINLISPFKVKIYIQNLISPLVELDMKLFNVKLLARRAQTCIDLSGGLEQAGVTASFVPTLSLIFGMAHFAQ